jgi:hypothetical protein
MKHVRLMSKQLPQMAEDKGNCLQGLWCDLACKGLEKFGCSCDTYLQE